MFKTIRFRLYKSQTRPDIDEAEGQLVQTIIFLNSIYGVTRYFAIKLALPKIFPLLHAMFGIIKEYQFTPRFYFLVIDMDKLHFNIIEAFVSLDKRHKGSRL